MRNNNYGICFPSAHVLYASCIYVSCCEGGRGKKKRKKKRERERNVRTLRIFTANSSSHFRFFSSHPSFFSPSFFPLLRVNRRKVIVQPFEARRDSPGPFFSFSPHPSPTI